MTFRVVITLVCVQLLFVYSDSLSTAEVSGIALEGRGVRESQKVDVFKLEFNKLCNSLPFRTQLILGARDLVSWVKLSNRGGKEVDSGRFFGVPMPFDVGDIVALGLDPNRPAFFVAISGDPGGGPILYLIKLPVANEVLLLEALDAMEWNLTQGEHQLEVDLLKERDTIRSYDAMDYGSGALAIVDDYLCVVIAEANGLLGAKPILDAIIAQSLFEGPCSISLSSFTEHSGKHVGERTHAFAWIITPYKDRITCLQNVAKGIRVNSETYTATNGRVAEETFVTEFNRYNKGGIALGLLGID